MARRKNHKLEEGSEELPEVVPALDEAAVSEKSPEADVQIAEGSKYHEEKPDELKDHPKFAKFKKEGN